MQSASFAIQMFILAFLENLWTDFRDLWPFCSFYSTLCPLYNFWETCQLSCEKYFLSYDSVISCQIQFWWSMFVNASVCVDYAMLKFSGGKKSLSLTKSPFCTNMMAQVMYWCPSNRYRRFIHLEIRGQGHGFMPKHKNVCLRSS